MRPSDLIIRCIAEKRGDVWVAVCLDFSLGAQADTYQEARAKLDAQIREYLHDALVGEDRAHANALLRRRAPLGFWLKYWAYRLLARARGRVGSARSFRETMPLVPAAC